MYAISFPRLRTLILAASIASSASLAFAEGSHVNMSPSSDTVASVHPFEAYIPNATDAWCDSLPYPYCDEPTPGAGRIPFVYPMPRHPLFGD